jgi:general secretion pathway protein E/type IV pilus assembly protein PilB
MFESCGSAFQTDLVKEGSGVAPHLNREGRFEMDVGQVLLRKGLVSETQLADARRAAAAGQGKALHLVLTDSGIIDESTALEALAEALGMAFVDLTATPIDPAVLGIVPAKVIYRQRVLPIERTNGRLMVATSDPFDVYAMDELQTLTGLHIVPVIGSGREIDRLVKQHFGVGGETVDQLVAEREGLEILDQPENVEGELAAEAQQASVVRLVNEILLEAIEQRASDVHIESHETGLKVRYRVDGMLQKQPMPPEIDRFRNAIISRLKIMARLNIAEKRLPQDGRIKLRLHGREIDVRVSVIPMLHGEGIVMRLLDKGGSQFDLRRLGMADDTFGTFGKLIQRPHGILLVTGPTGSGKTTTLYSALRQIRDEATKIVTVEDPVEYHLEGINQIQVHARIGLTFAAGLRSILRHDPDVILVGEIRDLETAETAIQSSLTGHLVFSTLHTNDAASAFVRLVDMGIEPYLVASTVEGIMAQRLVRVICSNCKQAYRPSDDELPPDFPRPSGDLVLYRGAGCRACRNIGYRGRLGIFELLVANEQVRHLTVERASATVIVKQALADGMITLRQDGWRKVLAGMTTVSEVLRVTKGDLG